MLTRRSITLALGTVACLFAAACVSLDSAPTTDPTSPSVASAEPSPSTTTAPAVATPAATPQATPSMAIRGRIVNVEQGFAVTLPDGWLRVDFDSEFGLLMREAMRHDPQIAAMCDFPDQADVDRCIDEQIEFFEQELNYYGPGTMLALSMGSMTAPYPTMALIWAERWGGVTTLRVFDATGEMVLRQMGITKGVEKEIVELDSMEGVRFSFAMPRDAFGRRGRGEAYAIPTSDSLVWVFVFGHRSDEELGPDAESIARSLEVTDPAN